MYQLLNQKYLTLQFDQSIRDAIDPKGFKKVLAGSMLAVSAVASQTTVGTWKILSSALSDQSTDLINNGMPTRSMLGPMDSGEDVKSTLDAGEGNQFDIGSMNIRANTNAFTVEISNDGQNWVVLWDNTSDGEIADDDWQEIELDISAQADNEENVYIRWGYEILDRAYPYSGWNIDDVQVWGNP